MPNREDVYKAWIKVQRLKNDLADAEAEHQRLVRERRDDPSSLVSKVRETASRPVN